MKKGGKMKRLTVVLALSLILSASAYAQMGGNMMDEQKGKTGTQGMMPENMMQMCMPMMKQMMGQGMMKDMMQMMMDMMDMQEKMMKGVKPSEKKDMMKEMAQMKERMQKMMMAGMMGMMGQTSDDSGKLKCATEWLKKAIDLHEMHIKDPKTATEPSQVEMMDQMKHAYECITGGPSEKADPHKH